MLGDGITFTLGSEVVFVDVDGLGWVGALVHFFVSRKDWFIFIFVFSDIVVMAVEFFFPFNWKLLCLISCKISVILMFMGLALKSSCFLQFSSKKAIISMKQHTPVAAISTMKVVGLSATFIKLKKEGKVSGFFFSIFFIVSHFN